MKYGLEQFSNSCTSERWEIFGWSHKHCLWKSQNNRWSLLKFNRYYQRVNQLSDTFKKLNKNRSTKKGGKYLDKFLNRKSEFNIQQSNTTTGTTIRERNLTTKSTTKNSVVLSKIGKELHHEKSKSASLSREVQKKTSEIKSLTKEKKTFTNQNSRKI